ncbi:MAG TPA: phytanoyl-CoA dioxygenase family protein, partial [Caldilineaceae bacterium]|nr:phytanoyl-CoA dioxygenase family protein [Caldilineaceae bacterium]
MKVTPAQVEQFWETGFLIVADLLDQAEVEQLRQRIAWVVDGKAEHIRAEQLQVEPEVVAGKAQAANYADSLRKLSHLAFYDEIFQAHATNPKILDVIESLLGPDIKLYQDQIFMKPPKIGSRQRYHQDMPLGFHIDPPDMVTCWAALDEATIENGCLWMLPGTHKFGIIDKANWGEYEELSVAGQLPEEQPVPLKTGSCSFHHGLILHSSRPNLTDQRRRGYATHYVSAHCRYTGDPAKNDALLVRGQSMSGRI